MSTDTVGIGVVGLGRVSPAHLAGLATSEHARIVAVCDVDERKAEDVAEEVGARPLTDYRHLLEAGEVDAVALLLPHRLHHPVARAALEAGKHIYVEKPFTVTEDEAQDLIEVASARDLVISVAENTRFVLAYIELQRLLADGALGEIRSIRGYIAGSAIDEYRDDAARWKREPFGAGTIIDTSPHMIYLLKWLFGDVVYIHTIARNWLPGIEVDDHATQVGQLTTGTMFSFEYCLVAEYPWSERVEVYGSEGSLIIDQLLDPPAVVYRGEHDVRGSAVDSVPYNMPGWKTDSIIRAAHDFVDAVVEGRPAAVDLDDARYVQRVIDCSYESARAGGARVEVGLPNYSVAT